jgi:hypothetical protein
MEGAHPMLISKRGTHPFSVYRLTFHLKLDNQENVHGARSRRQGVKHGRLLVVLYLTVSGTLGNNGCLFPQPLFSQVGFHIFYSLPLFDRMHIAQAETCLFPLEC